MAIIYALECTKNGFAYIGCTGNMRKRLREHRCLLRANKHAEPLLQADFNQYLEVDFQMVPLLEFDSTDVAVKRVLELHWMDFYKSKGLLYNTKLISFQPPLGAPALAAKKRAENGYKPSEETIQKRRLATTGIPKNHGAKISATKKRLGQKPTLEAARKGNAAMNANRKAKD